MTSPPSDASPGPAGAPASPPPIDSAPPAAGGDARAFIVGVLAAAACSGAVLGFGLRLGTPARGFNAIAALIAGDAARGVWGWDIRVTPVGVVLLVAVTLAWGALYVRLAGRTRGWRAIGWAVAVGLASWLVSTAAVLHRLGSDAGRVLGPGQLVALHAVLGVTLVVGMRFALAGNDGSRTAAARPES